MTDLRIKKIMVGEENGRPVYEFHFRQWYVDYITLKELLKWIFRGFR